jgi:hypothetical protein
MSSKRLYKASKLYFLTGMCLFLLITENAFSKVPHTLCQRLNHIIAYAERTGVNEDKFDYGQLSSAQIFLMSEAHGFSSTMETMGLISRNSETWSTSIKKCAALEWPSTMSLKKLEEDVFPKLPSRIREFHQNMIGYYQDRGFRIFLIDNDKFADYSARENAMVDRMKDLIERRICDKVVMSIGKAHLVNHYPTHRLVLQERLRAVGLDTVTFNIQSQTDYKVYGSPKAKSSRDLSSWGGTCPDSNRNYFKSALIFPNSGLRLRFFPTRDSLGEWTSFDYTLLAPDYGF